MMADMRRNALRLLRPTALTDIDARDIAVTGLPPLPHGAVAEGVDVIVRIRSRGAAN